MVAYSFKDRFVVPILDGTKRQTVRAPRTGHARHAYPGEELQLYAGQRTQWCRLIARAECVFVGPVNLHFGISDRSIFWPGPTPPGMAGISQDRFAMLDGFEDWLELVQWWSATYPGVATFEGTLIQWEIINAPA